MTESAAIAREFWRLMAGGDFAAVAAVLAPGFHIDWPQSGERIRGAENFARMNAEYPAHGPWGFEIRRILCGEGAAVTEVDVTDGAVRARAISFFEIENGRIARMTEYWPDPFAPAPNRAHLVERMPGA